LCYKCLKVHSNILTNPLQPLSIETPRLFVYAKHNWVISKVHLPQVINALIIRFLITRPECCADLMETFSHSQIPLNICKNPPKSKFTKVALKQKLTQFISEEMKLRIFHLSYHSIRYKLRAKIMISIRKLITAQSMKEVLLIATTHLTLLHWSEIVWEKSKLITRKTPIMKMRLWTIKQEQPKITINVRYQIITEMDIITNLMNQSEKLLRNIRNIKMRSVLHFNHKILPVLTMMVVPIWMKLEI